MAGRKPLPAGTQRVKAHITVAPATAGWLQAQTTETTGMGHIVDRLVAREIAMTIYRTDDATCPACLALNGQPLPENAGNIGLVQMGHQMYHTKTGPTAACILAFEPMNPESNTEKLATIIAEGKADQARRRCYICRNNGKDAPSLNVIGQGRYVCLEHWDWLFAKGYVSGPMRDRKPITGGETGEQAR